MKLTILGTSAAYPGPNDPCSGYLLSDAGINVLLDCGTGTLANLQRHVRMDEVSDIIISHMHPDHFLDLIPYRYALRYGNGGGKLRAPRLHLPPGGIEALAQLTAPFSETKHFFEETFDTSEYDPSRGVALHDLEVTFCLTKHYIPTYAMSLSGSRKLTYSSDSGSCPELVGLAKDSDFLLCTVGRCLGEEIASLWGHMLPREAGELARRAGAKQLMLTHLWPACDRDSSAHEASEALGRPVRVAEVNSSYVF